MNDCERIILDELSEVKKDVKSLLLDVNGLKVKSAMWGIVGGMLFTVMMSVVPLIWNNLHTSAVHAQIYQVDTSRVHVDR